MVRDRIFANSVTEDFIWSDIREIRKKMQAELIKAQNIGSASASSTGQPSRQNGIVSSTATGSRLDIISRKLFGLLAYLAREKTLDVDGYYATIKTVAGDERYNNLIQATTPSLDELTLEAELFFGPATTDTPEGAEKHKIKTHLLLCRDFLSRLLRFFSLFLSLFLLLRLCLSLFE